MNTSFGLTFIDSFGNENIINETILRLPAILSISWFNNGFFTITVKDKNGNITTEHNGTAEKNATQFWDLQLSSDSEIWHLHIKFESNNQFEPGPKEELTKLLKIDQKRLKISEEEFQVPPIDDMTDSDQKHRFKELDAHWMKIDPDKNIFRFVYNDFDKSINDDSIEWLTPIILIHGFKSNHLTWNTLVSHIWMIGFRNIYSIEILDPSDLQKNLEYLKSITDFLFEITGFQKFIIIAHSIGSWITKYFVRLPNQRENILLFISIASPQYGLFKGIMSSFYSVMGKVKKSITKDDTSLFFQKKDQTNDINQKIINVNINGSLLSLGGSDGVFKPQIVPEMINFIFNKSHLELNKCEETITVIKDLLLRKAQIYQLKLLSIKPRSNAKRKSFNFTIKSPDPLNKTKNRFEQNYPREGYVELEENQIFSSRGSLIILMSYIYEETEIDIDLEIYTKIHTLDTKEKLKIPLATNESIKKLINLETKSGYTISFESYSFKLQYLFLD